MPFKVELVCEGPDPTSHECKLMLEAFKAELQKLSQGHAAVKSGVVLRALGDE